MCRISVQKPNRVLIEPLGQEALKLSFVFYLAAALSARS